MFSVFSFSLPDTSKLSTLSMCTTIGFLLCCDLRRYNYRMPVSIWAGWAALAGAELKPAETVTLENQLLLGKTFSY
jgi:hypothetical protein